MPTLKTVEIVFWQKILRFFPRKYFTFLKVFQNLTISGEILLLKQYYY